MRSQVLGGRLAERPNSTLRGSIGRHVWGAVGGGLTRSVHDTSLDSSFDHVVRGSLQNVEHSEYVDVKYSLEVLGVVVLDLGEVALITGVVENEMDISELGRDFFEGLSNSFGVSHIGFGNHDLGVSNGDPSDFLSSLLHFVLEDVKQGDIGSFAGHSHAAVLSEVTSSTGDHYCFAVESVFRVRRHFFIHMILTHVWSTPRNRWSGHHDSTSSWASFSLHLLINLGTNVADFGHGVLDLLELHHVLVGGALSWNAAHPGGELHVLGGLWLDSSDGTKGVVDLLTHLVDKLLKLSLRTSLQFDTTDSWFKFSLFANSLIGVHNIIDFGIGTVGEKG